ncbi:MAG: FAD-binding oxidoreductase, partial [Lutibacter sp.]|nr:FAD-binding oxidoreductase [Lutibacter sp.]
MKKIPWKWGDPSRHNTLDDFPALANFLKERWNILWENDFTIPAPINLPRYTEEKIAEIRAVFPSISPEKIDFSTAARLRVAVGKSYHDILRIHTDDKLLVPDFVFCPSTREELDYFVKKASQNKIRLSPFGGGTNVVGALTIQDRETLNCRVDLRNFNALIELDETHMTATFQSGILGPDLESALNEKGYTMGHFPQSFEYTTLGGWVATRSAGQESSYYGKIEDMVERISVVTPVGIIRTNPYTHDASGINLKTLFIGSEGTLGIIAEVT